MKTRDFPPSAHQYNTCRLVALVKLRPLSKILTDKSQTVYFATNGYEADIRKKHLMPDAPAASI